MIGMIVACSSTRPDPVDASSDAESAPDACYVFCKGNDNVAIHLPCTSSGVQMASVTAPCAQSDGGPGFHCAYDVGVPFTDCHDVFLGTSAAGTCALTIAFEDGFVYTKSVTWTAESSTCCTWLAADTTNLVVEEPDASCD